MRFIGHLFDETQARRFAAYLLVQGVTVRAEQEPDGWALWVRDEDQVSVAREALDAFRAAPTDVRYSAAESEALARQRELLAKQRQALLNQVDMKRRWTSAATGPRPLTVALAALSVLVFLLSGGGENFGSILGDLTFCSIDAQGMAPKNGFQNILQGELWRLVTPIFIHFGAMHLLFNLMTLMWLASPVERVKGTPYLGAMTILIGVGSNILQYWATGNPLFGGMSGVLFGLIGYSWLNSRYDPASPIRLSPETMLYTMVFFVAGILRDFPPFEPFLGVALPKMANVAHGVGLALGLAFAWAPHTWRAWRRK